MNDTVTGYVSGGKWERDGDFCSDGAGFVKVAVEQNKPDLQLGDTVTIYRGREKRLTREEWWAQIAEEQRDRLRLTLDAHGKILAAVGKAAENAEEFSRMEAENDE